MSAITVIRSARSASSLLSLVLASLLLSRNATAQLSPSPDDYDVPRYESAHQDALQRLRNAETLLQNLEARRQQFEAAARREAVEVDQIGRRLERERLTIQDAGRAIGELEQNIRTAGAEMERNEAERASVFREIADQRQRMAQLEAALGQAQADAARNTQAAEDAERVRSAARQRAKGAESAVARAQAELARLENERVAPLESRKAALEREAAAIEQQAKGKQGEAATSRQAAAQSEAKAVESDAAEKRFTELAATMEKRFADTGNEQFRRQAEVARQGAAKARDAAAAARAEGDAARARAETLAAEAETLAQGAEERRAAAAAVAREIAEARAALGPAQREVTEAQQALATAQQEIAEAGRAVDAARRGAEGAMTRLKAIEQNLTQGQARLAQLEARPTQLARRQQELQAYIVRCTQGIDEQRAELQQARERLVRLTPQYDLQRQQLARAERDLELATRDRDQAGSVVDDQRRYAQSTAARLTQVRENLRRGIEQAAADGRQAGTQAGRAEGTAAGRTRGLAEGREPGTKRGFEEGTQAGIRHARETGMAEGLERGTSEGAPKGAAEGRMAGQREGAERGRVDGLAAGLEAGRTEGDRAGYAEGLQAGANAGGFERGRAEGEAAGSRRATQEAEAQGVPEGYARAEKEAREATLRDETIHTAGVNSTLFAQKVAASAAAPGYPHPAMGRAYDEAYATSRREAAARAFEEARAAAFDEAYDAAYRSAWDEALKADFSKSREEGFVAGRKKGFDDAFARARTEAHRQAFEAAYRPAYDANARTRFEEGRQAGRAAGFDRGRNEALTRETARGRAEGERQAYAETLPRALEAARARGYAEGQKRLAATPLLAYEGANLADENGDGFFAPGEAVAVTLVIRNHGGAPSARGLTLRLDSASEGLEITRATQPLPELPARTRATVRGLGRLRVGPKATPGREEQLTVSVLDGAQTLGTVRLALTPDYPFTIPTLATDPVAGADGPNAVRIELRNRSRKASAGTVIVELVSLDGRAEIATPRREVGRVESGQGAETELAFAVKPENANERVELEVRVFDGSALVARRRVALDTARRYRHNAGAAGLAVVSAPASARRAEAAQSAAGVALDLFDTRIEGTLRPEIARRYAGRLLVLPNPGELDIASAEAVVAAIEAGAHVLAPANAGGAAGERLVQAAQSLESRELEGLTVHQTRFFPAASALRGFVAFYAGSKLGEALASATLVAAPIEAKVTALASAVNAGDADAVGRALRAITDELVKEMRDDRAVDGKNFQRDREATRLQRFVTLALQQADGARRELLGLRGLLDEAAKDTGWKFSGRRRAILKILEPMKKAR